MSIYIQPDIYVRVEQFKGDRAPQPLPLANGFSEDRVYRVLGIHTASESAEAFLILQNDRNEMWFVSNRHFRIVETKILTHPNGTAKPAKIDDRA